VKFATVTEFWTPLILHTMNNHDWKNYFPDMDEWDIRYVNVLIAEEKQIVIPEGNSFLGLYLNIGTAHLYNIEGHLRDTINSGRYNFVFMPIGAVKLTLGKGIYAALCIQFSNTILLNLTKEYPMLEKLITAEHLKTPLLLSTVNMVITPEMNEYIGDILVNKNGYEGDLREVVKHSRVISLLGNALTNIEAMAAARLRRKDVDMVVSVHDYLILHLNGIFSVDQLADMVGVYRSKLEKAFKIVYRKSVMRFFLDEKIKRAATLLRDTNLQTQQIASKVGFKNMSRFSEAFKKYYACSPTEFRKLRSQ
jgi:AraC-like DNA-binding protein